MQAAARQLAAVGVERTFAVEADPLASFDVVPGLAVFAEPEGLDPLQRQVAESVVQLHDVDVDGPDGRLLPHRVRGVVGGHRGEVGTLVPGVSLVQAGAERFDGDRGRRSPAEASRRDTITATAPSAGTSQSYRHSGVEIIRASR